MGTFVIPILETRKLRLIEVKPASSRSQSWQEVEGRLEPGCVTAGQGLSSDTGVWLPEWRGSLFSDSDSAECKVGAQGCWMN